MKPWTVWCVAISPIIITHLALASDWNEEDERRRNIKIKEDEVRDYEMRSGRRDPFRGNGHAVEEIVYGSIDYGADSESIPSSPSQPQNRRIYRNGPASTAPDGQLRSPKRNHHSQSTQNWCFSCASPWSTLAGEMQQVVRNLFDVRRAAYPSQEFITDECVQPRNLEKLPRESCMNSHCQTLVLTDHNRGKSFTIRGCAEKFGAVDDQLLRGRGDNVCKKLHPNIDIVECICGKRRYCYAGDDRPQFDRFNAYELMRHDKDIGGEESQKAFHVASGCAGAHIESLHLRVSLLITAFIGLLVIKL